MHQILDSTILDSPESPDNNLDLAQIMWEDDPEITPLVEGAWEDLSEDTLDEDTWPQQVPANWFECQHVLTPMRHLHFNDCLTELAAALATL